MYIIIKTNLENGYSETYSEVLSSYQTKSECCKALYNYMNNKDYKFTVALNNCVKCYERGWLINSLNSVYQMLEISNEKNINKK